MAYKTRTLSNLPTIDWITNLLKCSSRHCIQNLCPHFPVCTASFNARWQIEQSKSSSTAFTNSSSYPLGNTIAWASAILWRRSRLSHITSSKDIQSAKIGDALGEKTRTQSLFMCLLGERRLGVRLRSARSHGKVLRPGRLNLTPNLLSPQKHINSDWVRVWWVRSLRRSTHIFCLPIRLMPCVASA